MSRKALSRLLVIVVLLTASACLPRESATRIEEVSAATPAGEGQPTATATPSGEATSYQVGDVVSIDDRLIVVLGWHSPSGNEFVKPDEGQRFVAVDVLLVNGGDAPLILMPAAQMSLKDATSQKYTLHPKASAAAGRSRPDGEVSPGERVRGIAAFQVPQGSTGLTFVFDARVFGTGKAFVELGPEPVAVEPPAELPGETEQMAFAVGDTIEIGELTLMVNEVRYPAGDDLLKPISGNRFVAVDVTLENRSTEACGISSPLQMYLKDGTGQKYKMDLAAQVASGSAAPDGELAPGERIRGQVGFQVPEGARGLVYVFDLDLLKFGKVAVALPDD